MSDDEILLHTICAEDLCRKGPGWKIGQTMTRQERQAHKKVDGWKAQMRVEACLTPRPLSAERSSLGGQVGQWTSGTEDTVMTDARELELQQKQQQQRCDREQMMIKHVANALQASKQAVSAAAESQRQQQLLTARQIRNLDALSEIAFRKCQMCQGWLQIAFGKCQTCKVDSAAGLKQVQWAKDVKISDDYQARGQRTARSFACKQKESKVWIPESGQKTTDGPTKKGLRSALRNNTHSHPPTPTHMPKPTRSESRMGSNEGEITLGNEFPADSFTSIFGAEVNTVAPVELFAGTFKSIFGAKTRPTPPLPPRPTHVEPVLLFVI
jgi:hypothetical protein